MQPNIFMWCGLLKTLIESDFHIILDVVKSSKNARYNRNKIAGIGKPMWFTIPFKNFKREKLIKDQILNTSSNTNKNLLNLFSLRYSNSCNFNNSYKVVSSTINCEKEETELCLIYTNFLNSLKDIGLPICNFEFASNLLLKNKFENFKNTDLVNLLLDYVEADTYLCSENSLNYASPSEYKVREVWSQKFISNPYPYTLFNSKINTEFIPNLSSLDIISYLKIDDICRNLDLSNKWIKRIN